ncbi:MAG: preprotein translocase subunit SecG [Cytophagales bacterium]|nr:preprotein translocase subunit SecG [Armatimonadota bacterium]
MQILVNLLTGILVVLSLCLITVVVMQTPKSEGFGGGVQNTPGGTFRGKAGYDEMLSNYTRMIAVGWFASAFLLAIFHNLTKAS